MSTRRIVQKGTQDAVVRPEKKLVHGPDRQELSLCAHPRIDNGQMDGALGKIWGCRLKDKGGLPNILGPDGVAQVDDAGLRG